MKPLAYIVYIRETIFFSPMCTFRKYVKNFEVKVSVQKGALRFREKFNNSFIQFAFPSIVVIW